MKPNFSAPRNSNPNIGSPDSFKQRENEAVKLAMNVAREVARTEMRLFGLELSFATVPKTKVNKIAAQVKSVKDNKWKEAIKLAKGNKIKALEIYDSICSS